MSVAGRGLLARQRQDLRHLLLGWAIGEVHDDAGSLARLAVDFKRTAMQFDDTSHDRQAEAGTLVFARELTVDLAERRQRDMHVLLVDADAGIADHELHA